MNKTEVAIYLRAYNQIKPGLAAAQAQLNSFSAGVVSQMRSLANNVAAMTGGILAAATAGMIAKSGLGFNATLESLESSFAVLYDSTDKAREKMEELVKFAATTPFELPEVANAARILENFGLAGDRYLRLVGDSASGVKRSLEEVAMALGRIQSGAFGEAFMRLAEMGVATRKTLEGEGLVFDRNGSYRGSADAAIAAVTRIMEQKFGGMMEVQSKQWEGLMSTLKDSWNIAIGELTEPLFRTLKPALSDMIKTLDEFAKSDAIQRWGDAIADAARRGLDGVTGITEHLRQNQGMYRQISGQMSGLAAGIGAVVLAAKADALVTWASAALAAVNPVTALAVASAALYGTLQGSINAMGGWKNSLRWVEGTAEASVERIHHVLRLAQTHNSFEAEAAANEHRARMMKITNDYLIDIGAVEKKAAELGPIMAGYVDEQYLKTAGLLQQFRVVTPAMEQNATNAARIAESYKSAAESAKALAEAVRGIKDFDAAPLGAGETEWASMYDAWGRPRHAWASRFGPDNPDGDILFENPEAAQQTYAALMDVVNATKQLPPALLQVKSTGDTAMTALRDGAVQAANTLANSFAVAIFATKEKLIDLGEIARGIFGTLVSFGVRFGLSLIPGMGPWWSEALGIAKRASGGPVQAGGLYVVGERGPELFSPRQNGTIVPNHAIGGSRTVTINDNSTLILRSDGLVSATDLELRRVAERIEEHREKIRRSYYDSAESAA